MSTETASRSPWTAARAAAGVFAAVEVFAFVLWMALARHEWFFADDWAFVAGRDGGSLHDLFRDHNSHWSTVPVIIFRVLWTVFGLRTYLPYLAAVILLHLGCAAMLRVIMRQVGVEPWVATVVAGAFALFGTGFQDIVWAFQVGFDAALLFGLIALAFADHDGGFGRRDALAGLAGIAALGSAAVGLVMVGAVTLAVLLRRGWRRATPLAVVYGGTYALWWLSIGREGAERSQFELSDLLRFVRTGVSASFGAIGQLTGVGVLLAALTIAGWALFVRATTRATFRRRAAAPLALAIGAPAFLVLSGYARVENLGPDFARASRYVHIVTALLLPAIAVGLDALVRRWRAMLPVVIAVFVVGVPGNVNKLADYESQREGGLRVMRATVLGLPTVPLARAVPRAVRPLPDYGDGWRVTIGWLLDNAARGKVPRGNGTQNPANLTFRLSILQRRRDDAPLRRCRTLVAPMPVTLRRNQSIVFLHANIALSRRGPGGAKETLRYQLVGGEQLTAVVPSLDLVLMPTSFFAPTVCNVPAAATGR